MSILNPRGGGLSNFSKTMGLARLAAADDVEIGNVTSVLARLQLTGEPQVQEVEKRAVVIGYFGTLGLFFRFIVLT